MLCEDEPRVYVRVFSLLSWAAHRAARSEKATFERRTRVAFASVDDRSSREVRSAIRLCGDGGFWALAQWLSESFLRLPRHRRAIARLLGCALDRGTTADLDWVWSNADTDARNTLLRHRDGLALRAMQVGGDAGVEKLLWLQQRGFYPTADFGNTPAHVSCPLALQWAFTAGRSGEQYAWYHAARAGHLRLLREHLAVAAPAARGLDAREAVFGAACGGQMHVLLWAMSEGMPVVTQHARVALVEGHQDAALLLLARLHPAAIEKDMMALLYDAAKGNLRVLDWLERRHGPSVDERVDCVAVCGARYGRIAVLEWALSRGYREEGEPRICAMAAEFGHLSTVQWLRSRGFCWGSNVCCAAAQNNHRGVVEWALANGCPRDEAICTVAARGGHLELLAWCWSNGCPLDSGAFTLAAIEGRIDVLEWLAAHGCPIDLQACRVHAGHPRTIRWLKRRYNPDGTPRDCPTEPPAPAPALPEYLRKERIPPYDACPWSFLY